MTRSASVRSIAVAAALFFCGPVAQASPLERCLDLLHTTAGAGECVTELLQQVTEPQVRARAYLALGQRQRANREFQLAARAGPQDASVRVQWGLLFLEAHQLADAEALFVEALKIDPTHVDALVGQARVALSGFDVRARDMAEAALDRAPEYAGAHLVMARLELEAGATELARVRLTPLAEDDQPRLTRLEAMALLAAADLLRGGPQDADSWTARALALAPRYGDIYHVPAHFLVMTRRYREAVQLLLKAVEIDPDNYAAHAALGTNLLRLNRMEEGRQHLETAFRGDRFNGLVVNTLRLLDTLNGFDEVKGEGHLLRLHPEESGVLAPIMAAAIERAAVGMSERYDLDLTRPVVIEMYRRHDDFAVRTAGLPGIGILGAAFGDVVVMDGPSAQSADAFDWYSALWHEIAHVYTLNATNNRISRWFSEGISMLEEWRHGPSARESVSLTFLEAYANGKLLPVADLENGFIRPQYQGQIEVSYVQSGLLCLMIAERWPDGIVRMLDAYRDGAETTAAFEQGLGIDAARLDDEFSRWLQLRYPALGSTGDFAAYISLRRDTQNALAAANWARAVDLAAESVETYADFVGDGSPWLEMALAAAKLGHIDDAREALLTYWRKGGRNTSALDELSGYLAGDADELSEVLTQLAQLEPLRADRHERLAAHFERTGDLNGAVVARKAILALDPYDKAGARYRVARLLWQIGRVEEARRHLLEALETAPRYKAALTLLLEMES